MCACAHFICRPPFLPADFKKEQAGRTQGFHTHVRYPSLVLSLSSVYHSPLSLSTQDRCRADASLPGEGAGGRTERRVGQSNSEVHFWQHTARTLPDDCHTATSW
jgi:hypothetical protein